MRITSRNKDACSADVCSAKQTHDSLENHTSLPCKKSCVQIFSKTNFEWLLKFATWMKSTGSWCRSSRTVWMMAVIVPSGVEDLC